MTVPWIKQVVPSLVDCELYTQKCPAVPVASADKSCHVPEIVFAPAVGVPAAAIQSDGRLIVARTVPVRVAAQFAGTVPERISNEQEVQFVDSIVSSRALRVATLN